MAFSLDSKVKDILKNPAAAAVLDKYSPDASKNPQMKLVGGLTLRKLASFPQSAFLQPHLEELDKELQAIFTRTYGEPKRKLASDYDSRTVIRAKNASPVKPVKEKEEPEDEYLLVDGYNIIFAWEELSDLAAVSIDAARYKLMDILSNYQGFRKICVIVVFDAYKVPGGVEKVQKYHNINVVYTKEAETADQYIEKVAIRIGRRYRTTVATSDGVIQLIIRSQGCILWSARDFREEIERVGKLISEEKGKHTGNAKNYLFAHADAETQKYLEAVRLGKNPEMP